MNYLCIKGECAGCIIDKMELIMSKKIEMSDVVSVGTEFRVKEYSAIFTISEVTEDFVIFGCEGRSQLPMSNENFIQLINIGLYKIIR